MGGAVVGASSWCKNIVANTIVTWCPAPQDIDRRHPQNAGPARRGPGLVRLKPGARAGTTWDKPPIQSRAFVEVAARWSIGGSFFSSGRARVAARPSRRPGCAAYLSSSMSTARVIKLSAVCCISVTMCRSCFQFSTVTKACTVFFHAVRGAALKIGGRMTRSCYPVIGGPNTYSLQPMPRSAACSGPRCRQNGSGACGKPWNVGSIRRWVAWRRTWSCATRASSILRPVRSILVTSRSAVR